MAGGGESTTLKYIIHKNVSSLREVKLELFSPKKFSSGTTNILVLDKGVVTTKTFVGKETVKQGRQVFFIRFLLREQGTTLYTRMSVMIESGIEVLKSTYCLKTSSLTLSQTGRKNHLLTHQYYFPNTLLFPNVSI